LRYAQSVNASLASAAIDAGLISAEDLARQIAQRTATVAVGACFVWKIAANILYANTSAHVAITHALWVGLAAVIGVVWLDRIQTQRLPAGMLRLVRQRWELPTTAAVLAALGIYIGVVNTWGMPVGWRAAALTPGLAVAACAAVLIAQYLQARRVP
jgi:ethanolamine ammonia-lyase large subunit